ncbi:uncharacterized protein LOC129208334 isoform X2 [Grus americana]|uniref:uncharacterized protein LOC129208334 isoform X2 n=1 Tax=Grus americana TaxID=9117 RepID=UPI002407FA33|nr:uncharacterized protein LOC129208334 isoform X2 [Grus americana]
MAEERGAELGAAPKRRREPVCRQRRSVRSAARRGRWQPSWGGRNRSAQGGSRDGGRGRPGKRRVPPGRRRGEAAHAGTEDEVGGGEVAGGQQAWRARKARLHGGGGRQQRGGSGVRRGCYGGARRGPPPRAAAPHAARPRSEELARSRRSQEKLHGSTRGRQMQKSLLERPVSAALHLPEAVGSSRN